jgi:putative acetyltransferase
MFSIEPNMNLLIREFRAGDEAALWTVFYSAVHEIASADYSPEQIQAWAPENPELEKWAARMQGISPFVAEVEGCVVGYGDVQLDGYIDHFYIKSAMVRKGVGSSLMKHIQQVALQRGISELYSNVSHTARPFFEKWGFVVESPQTVTVRGVTMRNFRMRKYINHEMRETH